MKQSRIIAKTLKEDPKEAKTKAHKLMLRGGYIRQIAAGVYTYMPLMLRTLKKIENIVREEMNEKDGQELLMPALQPKELWVESGRWERYTNIDGIMFAFKDRRNGEVSLGPTHEEVITDIIRKEIKSYKQLPVLPYQIQSKFRDEIRPRFGLIRAREFIMKDAYSFDIDEEGLHKSYMDMYDAYNKIFERCGLNFRSVEADTGAIGGSSSHEFMVLADTGEDTIIYCDKCKYAANQERAESKLVTHKQDETMKKMDMVYGENIVGVTELANFLQIPKWHTTKTMLYQADDEVVAVMVRGDTSVNEVKVQNFLNCKTFELATPERVKEVTGAEIGYAGPVNLPDNIKLLADNFTKNRTNFECGCNKTNYHSINVNFERDFKMPIFGDFKLSNKGDLCPRCDTGKLKETKGIEVGHIFKLGDKYSKTMQCNYLDKDGKEKPMIMGCYGIGISRIAAAAIEQNHDDKGIIWPKNIAPYTVHLIGLNLEKEEIKNQVDKIYEILKNKGIEVLYDDREKARPGEKFSDSDLLGLPIRITVSKKTLSKNHIEYKTRENNISLQISLDEAIDNIQS